MTATDDPQGSSRLEEFQREIAGLRLRGSSTTREGWLLAVGALLLVAGLVIAVVGWFGAAGTHEVSDQIPYLISGGMLGVGITVAGAALYVRFSLSRYFRYWLIRLIYEQREQTDRVVGTLERIEAQLSAREPAARP